MNVSAFTLHQSAAVDGTAVLNNDGKDQHSEASKRQLAWQRAMEQAEQMAWFSHPEVLAGTTLYTPDSVSQHDLVPVASIAVGHTADRSIASVNSAAYGLREDGAALSVVTNSSAQIANRADASDKGGAEATSPRMASDIQGSGSRGSATDAADVSGVVITPVSEGAFASQGKLTEQPEAAAGAPIHLTIAGTSSAVGKAAVLSVLRQLPEALNRLSFVQGTLLPEESVLGEISTATSIDVPALHAQSPEFAFAQNAYRAPGDGVRAMLKDTGTLADNVSEYAEDGLMPEAQRRETGAARASQREPMRIHAEWEEQGVRVWIGADLDQNMPQAQLIRTLTLQLQIWFTEHGLSLLSLVCNGQTVRVNQQAESTAPSSKKIISSNSPSRSPLDEHSLASPNFLYNTPKESS